MCTTLCVMITITPTPPVLIGLSIPRPPGVHYYVLRAGACSLRRWSLRPYPHTTSNLLFTSINLVSRPYRCCMPFILGPRPPTMFLPTLRPSPPLSPVPPSAPTMTNANGVRCRVYTQDVGFLNSELTSPGDRYQVLVALPPIGRLHADLLDLDVFQTHCVFLNPPSLSQNCFSVSTAS